MVKIVKKKNIREQKCDPRLSKGLELDSSLATEVIPSNSFWMMFIAANVVWVTLGPSINLAHGRAWQ